MRYKLLKGPKIRISIAGIIISRVKCNFMIFYQNTIVSWINLVLVTHNFLSTFFFLLPKTISFREEMLRLIWKEIASVEMQSIRQLRWPTWGNISSERDDFRFMTSLSLLQSKSAHFFKFDLTFTFHVINIRKNFLFC